MNTDLFSFLVGVFCGAVIILLVLTPKYVNRMRRADILSRHCETLQYCLDMCAETVEELRSSTETPSNQNIESKARDDK